MCTCMRNREKLLITCIYYPKSGNLLRVDFYSRLAYYQSAAFYDLFDGHALENVNT